MNKPKDGSRWTFLTNHARVLTAVAEDPGSRVRDIAERCLLTQRAVTAILADLEAARLSLPHETRTPQRLPRHARNPTAPPGRRRSPSRRSSGIDAEGRAQPRVRRRQRLNAVHAADGPASGGVGGSPSTARASRDRSGQ
ncbi:MarR family transcriptional regulator [Yinghuangia aomiensis]